MLIRSASIYLHHLVYQCSAITYSWRANTATAAIRDDFAPVHRGVTQKATSTISRKSQSTANAIVCIYPYSGKRTLLHHCIATKINFHQYRTIINQLRIKLTKTISLKWINIVGNHFSSAFYSKFSSKPKKNIFFLSFFPIGKFQEKSTMNCLKTKK